MAFPLNFSVPGPRLNYLSFLSGKEMIVLQSLRKVGIEVGRELNRAWENLSEGWRDVLSRGGNALTHFTRTGKEGEPALPTWGLLAAEVRETDKDILVTMEVPGMEKSDCNVTIEGNTLFVSGEKRMETETRDERYHVLERAYGSFQRGIPLPGTVDADSATASCRNGVLTVKIRKLAGAASRRIEVK